MPSLHKTIRKSIEQAPELALEHMLAKKFRSVGIRDFRKAARSLVSHLQAGTEENFTWGKGSQEKPLTLTIDEHDIEELEKLNRKIVDAIPKALEKTFSFAANRLVESFTEQWKAQRYLVERGMRSFRDNLEVRWGDGLDDLRMLLDMSASLGEQASERLNKSKARKGRVQNEALISLHVRSCQISAEIIVLLENGFADGAIARWRTLHEIATVAALLADGDDGLAKAYNDHQAVEIMRATERLIQDGPHLGERPLSSRAIATVKRRFERALGLYGPNFGSPYGWAAQALGKKRPTFKDIQDAANRSAMHSYYKMASLNVHATPHALKFRIGSDLGQPIAGASNWGLEEPGVRMADSLSLITYLLPGKRLRIDRNSDIMAILKVRDRAADNLRNASRELRRDENEVQRAFAKMAQ